MRISQKRHGLALWFLLSPVAVQAQSPMGLGAAMQRAREVSPVRRAALAEVTAARAAERQAGAMPNPALSGDLERTTRDDDRSVVTTVRLAQPLDIWGARSARRETTALRRQADALPEAARREWRALASRVGNLQSASLVGSEGARLLTELAGEVERLTHAPTVSPER